jgi:hypothetical protein
MRAGEGEHAETLAARTPRTEGSPWDVRPGGEAPSGTTAPGGCRLGTEAARLRVVLEHTAASRTNERPSTAERGTE